MVELGWEDSGFRGLVAMDGVSPVTWKGLSTYNVVLLAHLSRIDA